MIDPFYDGERTLQRDSHFIRTMVKEIRQSAPFTSLPGTKEVIGTLPYIVSDPQLPKSDRNLLSTQ
jgi:hypothetical protein